MRRGTHVAMQRQTKVAAYLLINEDKIVRQAIAPTIQPTGFKTKGHKPTIDLMIVRELAAIGCTHVEIAKVLGCSANAIEQLNNESPFFAMALEQGEGELKSSLRRKQIAVAMEGNPSMLIWLGKQYLGQVDKREIESKAEINIMVQRAQEELKQIPREQLLEAQRLLSMPVVEQVKESATVAGDAE